MQEIADWVEIHNRLARLARAQDDGNWETVRSLFTESSVYEHPGGRLDGAEAIVERTRHALQHLDASQHLVGSISVEVDGDQATSTAYFHAEHLLEGTPGGDLYAIAGSYADRWVRTNDGWRIASRRQQYQWRSGNRDVIYR